MAETPTPWETRPCSNGGVLIFRGDDHLQPYLQVMPESDGLVMGAARELLACCEAAEEYLSSIWRPCEPDCDCLIHDLRAVIAKALGAVDA